MKVLATMGLALMTVAANAQDPQRTYPSCDLAKQRTLSGQMGGAIKDPGQAHISMRANVLQADIGNARKARGVTLAQAQQLSGRVDAVRSGSDHYTRQQGFLSAAERASYDRELDAVAGQICRR